MSFPGRNKRTVAAAVAAAALLVIAGWSSVLRARAADAPSVVVISMLDDGGKMRFEPEAVTVKRGDVLEFVQGGSMPHNVAFVKNEAPTGADLGSSWNGSYLTKRGETYEVKVDDRFMSGRYSFICAPHAAMGMKGTITVAGGMQPRAVVAPAPAEVLPVVKGVQGAQTLKYEVADDGVKVFHVTLERIQWETRAGTLVEAWAFNRQIPGPTIRVDEGDRVRIVVDNKLPEATAAHWHGLEVPNLMDGVPGISQEPIAPGKSFTYEFTAAPAGTHLYHSHFNSLHQEEHGLYGMFIVDPRKEGVALRADREHIMIVGDGPLGFVINGKEFPDIAPIHARKGERIRVRWANLGGMYHPMHLHGGHFSVVAKDGFETSAPQDMNTLSIAPGETYDVVLEAKETGTWLWHCHVLSHVTGPKDSTGVPTVAGMVGVVQITDGRTAVADPKKHTHH